MMNTYRVRYADKNIIVNADNAAHLAEDSVCFYNNDDAVVAIFPPGTDFNLAEKDHVRDEMIKMRTREIVDRMIAERKTPNEPVNKELFERTAPKWNCVAYPNDGMHYVPERVCLWCGMTREQIDAEFRERTKKEELNTAINQRMDKIRAERDDKGDEDDQKPTGGHHA